MIKQLGIVAACALIGSACGLADIDALGSESAEVEIVNAEAGGSGEGIDSDTPDQATALGSGTVDDDSDSADGDTGGDDTTSGPDETAANPAVGDQGRIEIALADNISLSSDNTRMSTNVDRPDRGWGYLTIDKVYTASEHEDEKPEAGSKFAIVEYQLLATEFANFNENAFRLKADGQLYSPSNNINAIVGAGEQVNSRLVFEIPGSAQELQLESGVPLDSVDGFTTVFDIALVPFDATNPAMALQPKIADADVEAVATGIELTSDDNKMSTNLERPDQGSGELTVDGAYSTAKLEGDGAGPDDKYIVIEYQLLSEEFANFNENSFRLEADGERYGPTNDINAIVNAGEVTNGSLVFLVPRHTFDYVLEGGSPTEWEDGFSTSYEFWLPEPGTGTAQPADSDADTSAAGSVDVEAEASSITLTSDDGRMSTNPGRPDVGWGTLTVDAARTTAKIEQDGAGPNHKFVIVDYQLVGGDFGNFLAGAFRLEANGELYSPTNSLNGIVDAGEVFNGSLVFRVPQDAGTMTLKGGVVEGSEDGFRTSYEISFS